MEIEIETKATRLEGVDVEGVTRAMFHGKKQSELKLFDQFAAKILEDADAIRVGKSVFVRVVNTDERELWDYEWNTGKPGDDLVRQQSHRLFQEEGVVALR